MTFTAELEIDGSFDFLSPNFYHSGPGSVDYLETGDNKFVVNLNSAGIYYFYFEAMDDQYNEYKDTLAVMAYNTQVLDSLLQARWSTMLEDLNNGDMTSALSKIHTDRQQSYERIFGHLIPQMSDFMSENTGFTFVSVHGNKAKYKLSTIENGIKYKYPVTFIKGSDGLWKVFEF